MLPGCDQTSRSPVLNGFQSTCAPCLPTNKADSMLRNIMTSEGNRNGTIIYLFFPFSHFFLPFMKLMSNLVQFLITTCLILKICVGVRNESTRGPFCVSLRTSPYFLRHAFHQREWCWAFRNIFWILRPCESACWKTATCQNDTCTSTPITTSVFTTHSPCSSPHTW